jgi:tetratricopeptide (TPR) repeat protein
VIRGSSFEQQFRYADAILEYQDALKYDSSSTILYAIGKCYKELKKYDLATEFAVRSVRKDSTFIPSMELLADVYMMQMKIPESIDICRKLLAVEPNSARKFRLARLLEYQDSKEAVSIYEKMLEDNSDDVKVLSRLSDIFERTRDTVKLTNVLEKLFKTLPEKSEVSYDLLDVYLLSRNYTKAFELLNVLDNTMPSSELGKYYGNFGNELLSDSNKIVDNNIKSFLERIDNRFYFDWRIQLMGAYLSVRVKDSLGTEKFMRHSLDIADSIPDVPLAVGSIYMQNGNFESALQLFKRYEEKYNTEVRFPLYIGHSYVQLNDYQNALNSYYKALAINDNQLDAWTQLGLIYDRTKQYDSCDISYEKALSIDRTNALVNNNYAYSLSVRDKDIERALEMIKVAIYKDPNNSSYLDTYGWILYKLKNYSQALDYTLMSMQFGEAGAEVYEHLGYIYMELGDKNKAKESWERSLKLEPDNTKLIEELKK